MAAVFDRFADAVANAVARPVFFAFCAGLVFGWAAALPVVGLKSELWHLALNSPTTAVTFLLVALLHNTQHRSEEGVSRRLKALLDAAGVDDPVADPGQHPEPAVEPDA